MRWIFLQFFAILVIFEISMHHIEMCTTFVCINKCGADSSSSSTANKGYKLILANNRDEDIYRPTEPATAWLPKYTNYSKLPYRDEYDEVFCDQSNHPEPYNLCVYGPIDVKRDIPPNYYSTWIGINERGSLGNLLFFMDPTKTIDVKPRGVMVGSYIQNSSWESVDHFMKDLSDKKHLYLAFNYVQLEMSKIDGTYSLYYLNNNDTNPYKKMNQDTETSYYFSVSNSNLVRPFAKTVNGKEVFKKIINNFGSSSDKNQLVESLIFLMQNSTPNYPDENLASFMQMTDPMYEDIVKGVSAVKSNYTGYWYRAHTRTSTIILVDYDDNVEYYELNLTSWSNGEFATDQNWQLNSFKFKLKPLYKLNPMTPATTLQDKNGSPDLNFKHNLFIAFILSVCFSSFIYSY